MPFNLKPVSLLLVDGFKIGMDVRDFGGFYAIGLYCHPRVV